MNHRDSLGAERPDLDIVPTRDELDLPDPPAGRWPDLSTLTAGLLIACAVAALLVWGAP